MLLTEYTKRTLHLNLFNDIYETTRLAIGLSQMNETHGHLQPLPPFTETQYPQEGQSSKETRTPLSGNNLQLQAGVCLGGVCLRTT